MGKFLKIGEGIPVVIDVLRASSTIITALGNRIEEIIPVKSKKKALTYKNKNYLLIGEREGIKYSNFDLGNSPVDLVCFFRNSNANHTRGIIKTTNATDILCSISNGYIVSALNLKFAIESLKGEEISILMAGGKYGYTEDLIVGLALYGGIYGDVEINDKCIKENISKSRAAKHLKEIGFQKDVDFVIKNINKNSILPEINEGIIKKKSSY